MERERKEEPISPPIHTTLSSPARFARFGTGCKWPRPRPFWPAGRGSDERRDDETTTTAVTGIGFPLSAICYRIAASYSTHNLKIPGTLLGEWTASEHERERGCRMYCPNDCLTVDMT